MHRSISSAFAWAGLEQAGKQCMRFVFSGRQDDKTRLKQDSRKTALALASLYFPIMAGMAAALDPRGADRARSSEGSSPAEEKERV
jgi:hypothetical protein